jgi:AraC family transcriptional regulator
VEGLVLEMLSLSLRSREHLMSTTPRWLLDAQRLVKERFKKRLTLVELALAVGVHPAHLSRSFRRHFGISVAACIRRERLTWACRLLSETRLPVHEIALEAGYADQSHLTRALRLGRGLTPAVYRRRFGSTRSKMRA